MFPDLPSAITTGGLDRDAPGDDYQGGEEEDISLDEELANLSADVSKSAFDDIACEGGGSDLSFMDLDPAKISPLKQDQQGQTTTEPVIEPSTERSSGKDKLIVILYLNLYIP